MRNRSVTPPMPSDVSSAMEAPQRMSIPRSASSALSLGPSTRMVTRMLRAEQNHQFVAGPADVSCANGEDGISGPGALQQKFDGFVHGTCVMHILVASVANGGSQSLTGNTGYWRFTGGINIVMEQKGAPL